VHISAFNDFQEFHGLEHMCTRAHTHARTHFIFFDSGNNLTLNNY